MQQCGQQGAVPKLLGPGQWAHTGPRAMAQERFRSILQHSPAATCLDNLLLQARFGSVPEENGNWQLSAVLRKLMAFSGNQGVCQLL